MGSHFGRLGLESGMADEGPDGAGITQDDVQYSKWLQRCVRARPTPDQS